MRALIVSDIHIGDRYCRLAHFRELLQRLPDNLLLILAGDVIDDPAHRFAPAEQEVLALLARESLRRPVTWVLGNHDEGFFIDDDRATLLDSPQRFQRLDELTCTTTTGQSGSTGG